MGNKRNKNKKEGRSQPTLAQEMKPNSSSDAPSDQHHGADQSHDKVYHAHDYQIDEVKSTEGRHQSYKDTAQSASTNETMRRGKPMIDHYPLNNAPCLLTPNSQVSSRPLETSSNLSTNDASTNYPATQTQFYQLSNYTTSNYQHGYMNPTDLAAAKNNYLCKSSCGQQTESRYDILNRGTNHPFKGRGRGRGRGFSWYNSNPLPGQACQQTSPPQTVGDHNTSTSLMPTPQFCISPVNTTLVSTYEDLVTSNTKTVIPDGEVTGKNKNVEMSDYHLASQLQAQYNKELSEQLKTKYEVLKQKRIEMEKMKSATGGDEEELSESKNLTSGAVLKKNNICSSNSLMESLERPQEQLQKMETPKQDIFNPPGLKQELDKVRNRQSTVDSTSETSEQCPSVIDDCEQATAEVKPSIIRTMFSFWKQKESPTLPPVTRNKLHDSTPCPFESLKQDINSELKKSKNSIEDHGTKTCTSEAINYQDHQSNFSQINQAKKNDTTGPSKNNEKNDKGAIKKTIDTAENPEKLVNQSAQNKLQSKNISQSANVTNPDCVVTQNIPREKPPVPAKKSFVDSGKHREITEGKNKQQETRDGKPKVHVSEPPKSTGNKVPENIKKTAEQDKNQEEASSNNDQANDMLIACLLGYWSDYVGDVSLLVQQYQKQFTRLITAAAELHTFVKTFFGPMSKVKSLQDSINSGLEKLEQFPTFKISPYKEKIEEAIKSLNSCNMLLENRIPMIEENEMPSGIQQQKQMVAEVPPSPEYQATLPIAMDALRLFRQVCCEVKWTRGKVRALGEQLTRCQTQLDDINMRPEDNKAVNARRDILNLCNIALEKLQNMKNV